MRASEALLLGSTILKPLPRTFDNGRGSGCAIGMINRAVGGDVQDIKFKKVFPWMDSNPVTLPCGCNRRDNVTGAVMHLFDSHYETDYHGLATPWTIEMIADWLRTVEPAPPEEAIETKAMEEILVGVK